MSVKRYVLDENALMGGMEMFEDDEGEYVLHSDYAALLARHNALREAVAWVKECELVRHYVIFDALEVCALKEITRSIFAARAEVDALVRADATN